MKIFKIKFDSKMPTTRKVTVGKDDDFGLAIQIDGMQTQGPAKLLYAGQEVEANKDLIEGYNVFLLKAVKDSTIAIKDIDSQVTFQVDISIKNTDVVELGGAGGGDAVWEFDGQCTYSIPGVLSVDSCYQTIKSVGSITFKPVNGQASIDVTQDGTISLSSQYVCIDSQHVCIEAPCDICIKGGQVRIYDYDGRETLNIGSSQQWFGNSCNSTTIKGAGINIATGSGGIVLNATSNAGLCINGECITMKYGCGWQVFKASPSDNCIYFGNCNKTLELDASRIYAYVPNGNVDVNASNLNIAAYNTYFSNCNNNHYSYSIGTTGYCGTSFQYINYPVSANIDFTYDGNSHHFKTKTLAIVLSAIQSVFLNGQGETDFSVGQTETIAFNKLSALFKNALCTL